MANVKRTIPGYYFFRQRILISLSTFCVFLITAYKPVPQSTEVPEYRVKAVFLYNFTQFVKWPQQVFRNENTAFRIGVLGHDPFGDILDEVVKGEVIHGHPLEVVRYSRLEEVDCHILYISENNRDRLKHILSKLKDKNVLTVSDIGGFAKAGGMIEFVERDKKIQLRINQVPFKNAQLEISAKLLRLAEVVSIDKSL
ncbi:putative transmembrane protein [Fulvivirga imtechensis AK7]|uniref:Putative transmembrane protein n=1 Tax=Fulvivirga imtechensis AK7 TaxID=1237149 RepID=L8JU95_9BACT|nr:YfiR family protein [Fulvivirga imtechensis]ELR71124.1 putative transmembrane protein [Fulvivirga imtechensis AK7]